MAMNSVMNLGGVQEERREKGTMFSSDDHKERWRAVLSAVGAHPFFDEAGQVMPRGTLLCTPEKAHQLLTLRPSYQRPIDRSHASRIKQAMIDGHFIARNGSALCFSESGAFIDGQHRVTGVIGSGLTFEFDVTVVSDSAFLTIDSNNKLRTMPQLSKIMTGGEESLNSSMLSALVWDHVKLDAAHFDRLQRDERTRIAVNHPFCKAVKELGSNGRRKSPTAGLLVGALACVRVAGEPAMDFFRAAFTNNHVSSAAKTLANWYLGERDLPRPSVERARHGFTVAVNAWNAHVAGREVQRLQGPRDGKLPTPLSYDRNGVR